MISGSFANIYVLVFSKGPNNAFRQLSSHYYYQFTPIIGCIHETFVTIHANTVIYMGKLHLQISKLCWCQHSAPLFVAFHKGILWVRQNRPLLKFQQIQILPWDNGAECSKNDHRLIYDICILKVFSFWRKRKKNSFNFVYLLTYLFSV